MCEILDAYTEKSEYSGYKIAIKIDGNYYSPWSGMKYEIGKIPELHLYDKQKKFVKTAIKNQFNDILPDGFFYNRDMQCRTGVIKSLNDALDYRKNLEFALNAEYVSTESKNYQIIILNMTISNDLHYSTFGNINTITGNKILSIDEYKE